MDGAHEHFDPGRPVVLRYVLTDGRIEIAWPCRVVEDSSTLLALFIKAGTTFKADPKRTAAEKRSAQAPSAPTGEYIWRTDTLRLMMPGRMHSVWLFWGKEDGRQLSRLFVNLEEPFRRTPIGFDTQDHTLDIEVQPDLSWAWRDEDEMANHVAEGFFTPGLADAAREEGLQVIDAILSGLHPVSRGWMEWSPNEDWDVPTLSDSWSSTPATFWERRSWAYGV